MPPYPPVPSVLAYSARAHRAAAFGPVVANTWTQVPLDTVDYDPNSRISGGQYVVAVAGLYLVSAALLWNATAGQGINVGVNKNDAGTPPIQIPTGVGVTTNTGISIVDIIQCVAGDVLQLYGNASGAISLSVGTVYNYLEVSKIG